MAFEDLYGIYKETGSVEILNLLLNDILYIKDNYTQKEYSVVLATVKEHLLINPFLASDSKTNGAELGRINNSLLSIISGFNGFSEKDEKTQDVDSSVV